MTTPLHGAPGVIVIGAGLAGLFTALHLAPRRVCVVAGAGLTGDTSSNWAQGGIAASLGEDDDPQRHAADTLATGDGLCDPEIVALVTREAPGRIADLERLGVPFDREDGSLALGLEAAHSRRRIVRVRGDCSGRAIMAAVAKAALSAPHIDIIDGVSACDLAMTDGRVSGVHLCPSQKMPQKTSPKTPPKTSHGESGRRVMSADAVVLASGGIGHLYRVTTNPAGSSGEGLGMAARRGAVIADPEFVQFHPTAIDAGEDPAPLITEAVRGEGGILMTARGERLTGESGEAVDLSPRHLVSQAVAREMAAGGRVYLDARREPGQRMAALFPTVVAHCRRVGLDPSRDMIPVAPAAHYHMGGVAVDSSGRSSLEGLWVCGEAAATGCHGASRLASNSLLEALVFAKRAAQDINGCSVAARGRGAEEATPAGESIVPEEKMTALRALMSDHAGVVRDEEGLRHALQVLDGFAAEAASGSRFGNMVAAARMIVAGACVRRETRGSHVRRDCPQRLEPQRTFMTLSDADRIAESFAAPDAPRRTGTA